MGDLVAARPRSGGIVLHWVPRTLAVVGVAAYGFLQLGAYQGNAVAGFLGSRAWICIGVIALASSLRVLVYTARADIAARNVTAAIVFGFLFIFAFARINSFDWAPQGEGCSEIATVFDGARLARPDLGWVDFSFYQRPHRMLMINALPTLVAGRSLAAARLGYLLPVLLGMCLLYAALRAWDADVPGFRYVALLPVVGIPTCPLLVMWMRWGDSPLQPVALALLMAAWFLLCVRDRRPTHLLALAFFAGLASTCYPPGMLVWLLFLVLGCGYAAWVLIKGDSSCAFGWACALIPPILDGVTCLAYRRDFAGTWRGVTDLGMIAHNAAATARTVLLHEALHRGLAFASYAVIVPVVIYLAASLLLRNGWAHFVVSAWVVGCVAIGTSTSGYSSYPPEASVYRVMAVIPVALTGLAVSILPLLRRVRWRPTGWTCVAPLLVCLAFSAQAYEQSEHFLVNDATPPIVRRNLARVVQTVQQRFDPRGPFVIAAFVNGDSNVVYWRDVLTYLFPRHQGANDPQRCLTGVDTSLPAIVLVNRDGTTCLDALSIYAGRQIERAEFESSVPMVQYVFRASR